MSEPGINPKDALGLKKPPLRLVPPAALLYMARVMGLGAAKYGPYNWRGKPVRYTVYLEAAMRHILSALDGEELDPESGQPHAAHAAACMAIVLDAKATGNLVDDRPTPGAAARLIAEMTEKDRGDVVRVQPVEKLPDPCGRPEDCTAYARRAGRVGGQTTESSSLWNAGADALDRELADALDRARGRA
jgi:dATP/dGTP diphosphohydrolase